MKTRPGFGREEQKINVPYNEYIGTWVRICTPNGNLEMGKLDKIEGASLVLSPYLGIRSSPEYGPMRKVCYTRLGNRVSLPHVVNIEPSSEMDLFNHVKFMNTQQVAGVKKSREKDQASK